ncbi:CBS domain-containing protein [Thiohalorhabdus sp. Cl-TMA]|uniref:CBS domain-containing protein n=1 Tax=Thiohalorhabdus methylotrophus TaxID=3242694 RepID=A0ABV4TWU7_9GAMM
MLVKDLMRTDVKTISPLASVREALTRMHENAVKSLVVEKLEEDDAYGILTYTGILREIVAEEGDIDLTNVYDLHVKPALSVSGGLNVKYVARMMIQQNVKRLLVVDNNRLEGLISMSDIVQNILRMADEAP